MPVFQLSSDIIFPPPQLARQDGLLAVGGDLSLDRLLLAYQMGIFPWFSEGDPIRWWAPDPRLVLFPAEMKISRRLARTIRQNRFNVTMDTDFPAVIRQCAHVRLQKNEETWITEEMIKAYCLLHEAGYAHSIETRQDGELVGGMYGVSMGGVFFGESMFSKVADSSKVALVTLVHHIASLDFDVLDCQVRTAHLVSMGAREVPAAIFYDLLRQSLAKPDRIGRWTITPPA